MMSTVLDYHDALLLDLDGTVYAGGPAIPGAVDTLSAVRQSLYYITNNASRSPQVVADQLNELGLPTRADQVITSATVAVDELAGRLPAGSTVLVVGADSLVDLVDAAGLVPTRMATDQPVAVIHGHNPLTDWAQLSEAALAIRAGAAYYATNLDTSLPSERGLMVGNGSLVKAVETATGVQAISSGKPAPAMFHQAAQRAGAHAPLAIGDRLDTDIAGGNAAGMDSFQVLTGVSGHHAILAAPPEQRPRFVADDLTGLHLHSADVSFGPRQAWQCVLQGEQVIVSAVAPEHAPISPGVSLLLAVAPLVWHTGHPVQVVGAAGDERAAAALATWW